MATRRLPNEQRILQLVYTDNTTSHYVLTLNLTLIPPVTLALILTLTPTLTLT